MIGTVTTGVVYQKCWSPQPPNAYTFTDFDGEVLGIGTSKPLLLAPGAWNLLWLSTPIVDLALNWKGPVEEYPANLEAAAFCIGAAYQFININEGEGTYGELSLRTTPTEFLAAIRGDTKFLLPAYFGETWWERAEERAALYQAPAQQTPVGKCRVPYYSIPIRSHALFQARAWMEILNAE